MKKFILRILLFLLPVLIIVYAADVIFSTKLRESRLGEFSTWEDIYNGQIDSDIVAYGSSRALVHIDSRIVEEKTNLPTYNLGMDGQNIWLQNLRHIEYLKYNRQPKVIIYSLDEFMFKDHTGVYNPEQFLPYILWQHPEIRKQLEVYNFPPYNGFDYTIPFLRYVGSGYFGRAQRLVWDTAMDKVAGIFPSKKNEQSIPAPAPTLQTEVKEEERQNGTEPANNDGNSGVRIRGYFPHYETWNNDFDNALRSEGKYEAQAIPEGIELFDKVLTELKQRGIYVILVFSPEYIEGQRFISNREDIMNIFKEMSKKHNLPYLDYSDHYISHDKKYFYNSMHMNAMGAELFTEILMDDIDPLLKPILNK